MLKLLNGKPVLSWVYERLEPLNGQARIIIATDDNRIKALAEEIGAEVLMTSPNHQSGTDRCAEVAALLDEEIIINVQGDEPFIERQPIQDLINYFRHNDHAQIATLVCPIQNENLIKDKNTVKVVKTNSGKALYFSRSAIPSSIPSMHFKHIGVYAFRKQVLMEISKLPPSKLELAESLEQLRWLENDFSIHTLMTDMDGLSIDTEEDLKKAELMIKKIKL